MYSRSVFMHKLQMVLHCRPTPSDPRLLFLLQSPLVLDDLLAPTGLLLASRPGF